MSLRASTVASPVACSGLMYAGVPSATPVSVSVSPPAALTARATPKSATRACPDSNRMFSGLMSRCTTPASCARPSAPPTSRTIRITSATGSFPSRFSRSRSVAPSTYGMT